MALVAQIDKTYFTGIINLDLRDDNQATALEDYYIPYYQRKIFTDLLGEALYQDLVNNSSDERWANFLDGETVTIDSYKYDWIGAKAMLSYFVYYYFKRDNEGYDTPVGEMKTVTENSQRAPYSLQIKLARAYNQGVEHYLDAYDYMDYKNSQVADTYPELNTKAIDYITIWGL